METMERKIGLSLNLPLFPAHFPIQNSSLSFCLGAHLCLMCHVECISPVVHALWPVCDLYHKADVQAGRFCPYPAVFSALSLSLSHAVKIISFTISALLWLSTDLWPCSWTWFFKYQHEFFSLSFRPSHCPSGCPQRVEVSITYPLALLQHGEWLRESCPPCYFHLGDCWACRLITWSTEHFSFTPSSYSLCVNLPLLHAIKFCLLSVIVLLF